MAQTPIHVPDPLVFAPREDPTSRSGGGGITGLGNRSIDRITEHETFYRAVMEGLPEDVADLFRVGCFSVGAEPDRVSVLCRAVDLASLREHAGDDALRRFLINEVVGRQRLAKGQRADQEFYVTLGLLSVDAHAQRRVKGRVTEQWGLSRPLPRENEPLRRYDPRAPFFLIPPRAFARIGEARKSAPEGTHRRAFVIEQVVAEAEHLAEPYRGELIHSSRVRPHLPPADEEEEEDMPRPPKRRAPPAPAPVRHEEEEPRPVKRPRPGKGIKTMGMYQRRLMQQRDPVDDLLPAVRASLSHASHTHDDDADNAPAYNGRLAGMATPSALWISRLDALEKRSLTTYSLLRAAAADASIDYHRIQQLVTQCSLLGVLLGRVERETRTMLDLFYRAVEPHLGEDEDDVQMEQLVGTLVTLVHELMPGPLDGTHLSEIEGLEQTYTAWQPSPLQLSLCLCQGIAHPYESRAFAYLPEIDKPPGASLFSAAAPDLCAECQLSGLAMPLRLVRSWLLDNADLGARAWATTAVDTLRQTVM